MPVNLGPRRVLARIANRLFGGLRRTRGVVAVELSTDDTPDRPAPLHRTEDQFEVALSEVANALQAATLLAAIQRRQGALSPDGVSLEAAIFRATSAVRQLRREPGSRAQRA